MIKVKNLSFGYNSILLKNLSFEIPDRSLVGVIGPNGSGKSTLLKILAGLIKNFSGDIVIDTNSKFYMSQNFPYALPATTLEIILTGNSNPSFYVVSEEEINQAKKLLKMLSLPIERYNTLSGGQKQKTLFARALFSNADLLLLDEPFSALDVVSAAQAYKHLKSYVKSNKIAIIASHDIGLISKYVDWIICLGGKSFISCHIDEFDINKLGIIYGDEFKVIHHVH